LVPPGDPADVVLPVACRRHDLAEAAGVKILQVLAPFQIADATFHICLARRGPALDMLSAHRDTQMIGSLRRDTAEP